MTSLDGFPDVMTDADLCAVLGLTAGEADVYAVASDELGDFDVDLSEITYERGRVWIGINAAPEGTADKLAAPAVGGVQ